MRVKILLIGLAMIFFSACKREEHKIDETGIYQVTNPVQRDTTFFNEYVCQIKSIQHIELRALERGYLQKIYVDEGQTVKKGQLLFQIMPLIYKAEMQKAKAEVDFAEIEYKNTKSLADNNIVSANELAMVKAKLDKANAELALAKVHVDFTEIRAPFDGIIGRFNDVRLGSLVEEGDLLTTLSDNTKMWVYFNVPEAEYLAYAQSRNAGKPVQVKLKMANNELFSQPGIIETIESDFNNETGNIAFRATFNNPGKLIRHGQTGNILMPVVLKKALLIPQKATFEVLDKKYVFVIDKDHKVRSIPVKVEHEIPNIYAVKAEMDINSIVLIDGLRKVKNGDKIDYKVKSFDSVIKEIQNLQAE